MYALIPHKDTLFLLAQTQRSFIASCNAPVYPRFPLWCVYERNDADNAFEKRIISCTILPPAYANNEFFFPVQITSSDGRGCILRIVFATADSDIKKAPDFSCIENSDAFPLQLRVFRTGTVTFKDNGWSLTDDHWIKLS